MEITHIAVSQIRICSLKRIKANEEMICYAEQYWAYLLHKE